MHLPLSERLGEECWLLGVLTEGPTGAPRNSFSRDESPLPWRREQEGNELEPSHCPLPEESS